MSNVKVGSDPIYDARSIGVPRMLVLGVQHMFAMFGATVLVPASAYPQHCSSRASALCSFT